MAEFNFETYVTKTLDELRTDVKQVKETDIPAIHTVLAEMKARRGIWAAALAAIPGIAAGIAVFVK